MPYSRAHKRFTPRPDAPVHVRPETVYTPEVIVAVKAKLAWFSERGFPERGKALRAKFFAGKELYPCEWYMGPTNVINPHLTIEDLTPPSGLVGPDSSSRKWARYASKVSKIDPEILRELGTEDIVSMLIADGAYNPNWEIADPQDTVVKDDLDSYFKPKVHAPIAPTTATTETFAKNVVEPNNEDDNDE